jgi:hypothetical protein
MDIVKKRMYLLKGATSTASLVEIDDGLDNLSLLNTIKVPKNLA